MHKSRHHRFSYRIRSALARFDLPLFTQTRFKQTRSKHTRTVHRVMVMIITLGLLVGCQSSRVELPAISASAHQTVVWHDLLSPDVETSGKFMSQVLGWNVSTTEYYTSIYDNDGRLVGGMVDTLAMDWGLKAGGWLMSMQSPDLDVTLVRVTENGGKVLLPPRVYPNRGLSALVQDPQGAVFEVLQLSAGDNAEHVGDEVWIWHELITSNPAESAAWYARVFELQVASMDGGRQLLKKGSVKLATISSNPFEDQRNQWIPVVATGDFETTVGRVSEWGGRVAVVLDPPESTGRLALIQDPTGAAMLLQEQEQE